MDKRDIAKIFSSRLRDLINRDGTSMSAFARDCGLDRSALSQFLDPDIGRLPRSETLAAIASGKQVSVDWLLGLSQDKGAMGEVATGFNIETASGSEHQPLLTAWHTEAAGYKIRYSPATLPDLLRTRAIIEYEFANQPQVGPEEKADLSRQQLDYSRLPETDMEVVMPWQRLENFAQGSDIWSGLERGKRVAQLEHIANLVDELYPTFRLFLYDGRSHFLAPYTVFGPKRAAIYLGNMYLVINSVDHIRQLTRRFDETIRAAQVSPTAVANWISGLKI